MTVRIDIVAWQSQSKLEQLLHQIDVVGRFWFGESFPDPAGLVEAAGWRQDELTAYCSLCGHSVGQGEKTSTGCATCRNRPERRIADGVVRLGTYSGVLQEWVLATKFRQWEHMGQLLGRHLARQLRRSGMVEWRRAVLVPMPMPWQRRMFRGTDHARVLAAAAARELGGTMVPILKRSNGPMQTMLDPTERLRNAKRGMSIKWRLGGWPLEKLGADVVLVDDVCTTGSSLRAGVRLLRELKPRRIIAAVVAVSDEAARRARVVEAGVDAVQKEGADLAQKSRVGGGASGRQEQSQRSQRVCRDSTEDQEQGGSRK